LLQYDKKLKKYAGQLRNNMTDAENILWLRIKGKQLNSCQFYRQKIIGEYIVDFYCPKAKVIIELDGGQHYLEDGEHRDMIRDKYLKSLGLKVLRYPDNEVLDNINLILEDILRNMQ